MQIADDFIDNIITASCQLARHRKSSTVEVKDVQFHLGTLCCFASRISEFIMSCRFYSNRLLCSLYSDNKMIV